MNQREYLVSKGLAKPGRGRFSADAKIALAEARKSGMVFDDDNKPVVKSLPRVNTSKKVVVKVVGPSKPTEALDLGQVRLWARDNGYVLGDRGRIPQAVTDAYRASCAASGEPVAVKATNEFAKEAPRRFPEGTKFVATVTEDSKGNPLTKAIKVNVSDRTACKCGVSLPWCRCARPQGLVASSAGIKHEYIDAIY